MTTGYFLSRNHWAGVGAAAENSACSTASASFYLPVNLCAGSFTGPADVLRKLLVDGTFYHLWYFRRPFWASSSRWLSRLGLRVALPVAALLYLIGLGGDSYYGLVSQIPLLRTLYDGIFTLCGYTRNGCSSRHCSFCLGPPEGEMEQKLSLAASSSPGSHERRGLWPIAWMSSATTACTSPSPCA